MQNSSFFHSETNLHDTPEVQNPPSYYEVVNLRKNSRSRYHHAPNPRRRHTMSESTSNDYYLTANSEGISGSQLVYNDLSMASEADCFDSMSNDTDYDEWQECESCNNKVRRNDIVFCFHCSKNICNRSCYNFHGNLVKLELEHTAEILKKEISRIDKFRNRFNLDFAEIKPKFQEVKGNVDSFFTEYIMFIQERKGMLQQEANMQALKWELHAQDQIKEVNNIIVRLESQLDKTKNIMRRPNVNLQENIQAKQESLALIETLRQEKEDIKRSYTTCDPEFSYDEANYRNMKIDVLVLGKVQEKNFEAKDGKSTAGPMKLDKFSQTDDVSIERLKDNRKRKLTFVIIKLILAFAIFPLVCMTFVGNDSYLKLLVTYIGMQLLMVV